MIRRRRLAEAEASSPLLVEPVSEDPASMARLDLEILLVDRSNGFCGYASNAVAVDKDRHGTPPSCPLLHPMGPWSTGGGTVEDAEACWATCVPAVSCGSFALSA